MSSRWECLGPVSPGGTVFACVSDPGGRVWLATGAGIFHHQHGTWRPLAAGQPLSQVTALACAENTLLAGGSQGEIAYSVSGGETWYLARTEQVQAPITSLAPSPAFGRDGVVLAGTDGAGILRSTDGGRNWDFANFGLQDFTVITMATAPEWGRREVVFAATPHGLYRSPNGGRAWKRGDKGMEGTTVLSLAVSPHFSRDGTLFAGTETRGLFRSTDGGKSWHPWGKGLGTAGDFPAINALWLDPDFPLTPVCLVGTGDGRIFRSQDGGATWTCVVSGQAPVLSLAGLGERLYAGLHVQGLLLSGDKGQTWTPERALAARAITRLVSGPGGHLFAFGPFEGVWRLDAGGNVWSQVSGIEDAGPILALAASPERTSPCSLAATVSGLLRSSDGGQTWRRVLGQGDITTVVFSSHFPGDNRVWAGTQAGEVLVSLDGGLTWATLRSPGSGGAVMALAVQSRASATPLLALATWNPDSRQLTIWRSADGGDSWHLWMKKAPDWPSVHLSLPAHGVEGAIACVERTCWRWEKDAWQRVLEVDRPILRLWRDPSSATLFVLTPVQVLHSADGLSWTGLDVDLRGHSLVDLVLSASPGRESMVYLLGTGGVVWRGQVRAGSSKGERAGEHS